MRPIDAEDMVQARLNADGLNASAVPLPDDYDERLPFALVTRTGGQTYHTAADMHVVSIDVYAGTWAAATEAASKAVESVRALAGRYHDGVQVYRVDCDMPYTNPDPAHLEVPRMTFAATVEASGKES